jgi:MFS family permease
MTDLDLETANEKQPWYAGVTRYEWMVLVIACAGWVFDVYEGQIFNITRSQMLADIVGDHSAQVANYGDLFLGIFLLGGTIGGLAAGSLADRFGRRPLMVATILIYSVFSGLTFFATELWHVAALRFIVALGVGGEWAVAASLVAEVFPARARAHASGIFHASSILGTWMAAIVGIAVGANWRYAYLIGILPALLILWVRAGVKEPQRWRRAADEARRDGDERRRLGSMKALLLTSPWNRRAILGMCLAAVGLGTFWAVTVAGQDLAGLMLEKSGVTGEAAASQAKFAYGIVQTAGGGLGLLSFGPLSARLGRRRTFVLFHVLAFAIVPVTCFAPQTYSQLLLVLPVFGFLTLGMHAGYAIYFPELFPTHLRATGASFCFNGGRLAATPIMVFSAALKGGKISGIGSIDLRWALTGLSLLFLLGIGFSLLLPETNARELPS